MSKLLNGNGNGGGPGSTALAQQIAPQKTAAPANTTTTAVKESRVIFRAPEGGELRGALAHFTRHTATFEMYGETVALRTSEALTDFQIHILDQTIYSGRAVVSNLVDNASKIVCEVDLDETHWNPEPDLLSAMQIAGGVESEFNKFEREWQKLYIVSPDFKVIVADIQTFLQDLKIWLDQVEFKISSVAPIKRKLVEKRIAQEIGKITSPKLTGLFERFEAVIHRIEPASLAAHSVFAKRMLHPLLLGSPFLHRTFYKPLGYAGDYEMVNMLSRDPFEGKSLYAKIINLWFWEQPPAEAHRNRLIYLEKQIEVEALRLMRSGRKARIFNFACGPALEIQNFLKNSSSANRVEFTLADFNGETLEHTKRLMESVKTQKNLKTSFRYAKKSVHQLLKESGQLLKAEGGGEQLYDFVYCAGLFDYLSDRTCTELMNAFNSFVAPGGLLVATNVDTSNPRIPTMDHVMAWHLIYRNSPQLAALRPASAALENCTLKADATGVNIFLEVRKPENA